MKKDGTLIEFITPLLDTLEDFSEADCHKQEAREKILTEMGRVQKILGKLANELSVLKSKGVD